MPKSCFGLTERLIRQSMKEELSTQICRITYIITKAEPIMTITLLHLYAYFGTPTMSSEDYISLSFSLSLPSLNRQGWSDTICETVTKRENSGLRKRSDKNLRSCLEIQKFKNQS